MIPLPNLNLNTKSGAEASSYGNTYGFDESWHQGDFSANVTTGGMSLGGAGGISPMLLIGGALLALYLFKRKG